MRALLACGAFYFAATGILRASPDIYVPPCIERCLSAEHVAPDVIASVPVPHAFLDLKTLSVRADGSVFAAGPDGSIFRLDPKGRIDLYARESGDKWSPFVATRWGLVAVRSGQEVVRVFECTFWVADYAGPYQPVSRYHPCATVRGLGADLHGTPVTLAVDRDDAIWFAGGSAQGSAIGEIPPPWGPATANAQLGKAFYVFDGGDGNAYAALADGTLLRLNKGGSTPAGPARLPAQQPNEAWVRGVGSDGSLWAVDRGTLYHRHPDGRIARIGLFQAPWWGPNLFESIAPRIAADGSAWFLEGGTLYRVTPGDRVQKFDTPPLAAFALAADGTVWYATDGDPSLVHAALPNGRDAHPAPAWHLSLWRLPEGHGNVRALLRAKDGTIEVLGDAPGDDNDVGTLDYGESADGAIFYRERGAFLAPLPNDAATTFGGFLANVPGGQALSAATVRGDAWMLVSSRDRANRYLVYGARYRPQCAPADATLDELRAGADAAMYAHGSDGTLYRLTPPFTLHAVSTGVPATFAVARDGALWFALHGKLYRNGILRRTGLGGDDPVESFATAPDGRVWFAAGNTLCAIGERTQTCYPIDRNLEIRGIFPQIDGSLWFSAGEFVIARLEEH